MIRLLALCAAAVAAGAAMAGALLTGSAAVQYALDAGVGRPVIAVGMGVLALVATGLIDVVKRRRSR